MAYVANPSGAGGGISASQAYSYVTHYQNLKSALNALLASVESCQETIPGGSEFVENVVIDGEPIDAGNIEAISSNISAMIGAINSAITECNEKINTYQTIYNSIIANTPQQPTAIGETPNPPSMGHQRYIMLR